MMKNVNKKIIRVLFFILCSFLQLGVVLFMVLSSVSVLKNGTEYKFKLIVKDPADIFRGKYLYLNYDDRAITYYPSTPYEAGTPVYVQYDVAEDGFASLSLVETECPEHTKDFLKTIIDSRPYLSEDGDNHSNIVFPITSWYMNEDEVQKAEQLYQESKEVYASIFIRDGKARIKGVYFDGISIDKAVEEQNAYK